MNLDMNKIPRHIAIILDGNGRWAKSKLKPRFFGHREGAINVSRIAKECEKLGVEALTCFCFSTENWKRPEKEVNYLMTTPVKFYKRYKDRIINSNYKIQAIGRRDRIPAPLLNIIDEIETKTKDHTGLKLTLCIDYGSYEEITTAVKRLYKKVEAGEISIDDITEKNISDELYTKGLPELDLLIRTSGEERISNFLLWQLAYAELYFTDVYWPAFNKEELYKAIDDFQHRSRRFGGLKEDKK